MKTLSALIFCISVILLLYLSGAINKEKPQLVALEPVILFDRIDCMADCTDHNILGTIEKGEAFTILSKLKGKSKTVLRVETPTVAGWTIYNESIMQKVSTDDALTKISNE